MPDKFVGSVPAIAGKAWDRAAIELHEYLRKANYAHNLGVDLQAISISGGNTTGTLAAISSGTIYLSATNNLTLSQNKQSIGISGPTLMSLGVSTGGNTAGTTGLVASRVVLYGGSNVSLSQSVSGHSATITWNVHPPIGIAAGTQTATTGTVVFANSNNVTFGMSGSNSITASVTVAPQTGISGISAGTTLATSGTILFANSNGVSFGVNGQTLTASITPAATQSYYANFDNMVGYETMTIQQSTSAMVPFMLPYPLSFDFIRLIVYADTLAASTTAATTGNTSFSGGHTRTHNLVIYSRGVGASSNSLQSVTSTQITDRFSGSVSAQTNSTQFSYGMAYTFPCSSGSSGFTKDYFSNAASLNFHTSHITDFVGDKVWEMPFGGSLNPGQYFLAYGISSSTATQLRSDLTRGAIGLSQLGVSQIKNGYGTMGIATNASINIQPGAGSFSIAGGGTTASVELSRLSGYPSQNLLFFQLMRVT